MVPVDSKYQDGSPPVPTECESDIIISPDTHRIERIPPGQVRTRKWPVLQAGNVVHVNPDTWSMTISGLVQTPIEISYEQFKTMPRVRVFSDFHCVTTWSRLGNLWEGVSVREVMKLVDVQPAAKFVVITGHDNEWTTNVPLAEFSDEDCLFADTHDGEPIDDDHGGPVRLVVPKLYAWKSAKWVKSIELVAEDSPGYWERNGYHMHGDPWTEERFSHQ